MNNTEQQPHLIIGIDVEGSMSSISGKAGALAEQMIGKNEIIDFIKIEENNSISSYFLNETQAFYQRK